MKKGNTSWKPAKLLQTIKKDPKYEYRWCDKDQARMLRHYANGWRPVSKLTGGQPEHTAPDKSPLTSVTEYRELVLCAIPKDEFQQHREYYEQRTLDQTAGIKAQLKGDLDRASPGLGSAVHGHILIK